MNDKHLGSDFDDFLREEHLFEDAEAVAAGLMKAGDLKRRLREDRPMTTISLRLPQDVVDDLKRIAPRLGFSGYQPLLLAYVDQGLRRDLERLR